MGLKFKLKNDQCVDIINDDGKKIGHVFTPSGSGGNSTNAIQVCGFSDAFDFWGCGVFKGFKDIQLLFDEKPLKGSPDIDRCPRCFMSGCQCDITDADVFEATPYTKNPFIVKRAEDLHDRIKHKDKFIADYNRALTKSDEE